VLALLVTACTSAPVIGPQQASFPARERVARSGPLSLELTQARYDLRQVSLQVSLANHGKTPLHLDREGILLAYGDLEYPLAARVESPLAERTTLPPGDTVRLELAFVTEQAMVEAATLQLLSISGGDDDWLAPLKLAVPPPAAFVDAAAQAEPE
jgi:hypothetical protein